jgi:hypothetical protein
MIKARYKPTIPEVKRPNIMCALDSRVVSTLLKIGVLTGLARTHVCDCIFAGRSSIRNPRTRHAVVTGTH